MGDVTLLISWFPKKKLELVIKNVSRDRKETFYEHSQNAKLFYKKYYFGIEKHISQNI
jgi:hypothetical protein